MLHLGTHPIQPVMALQAVIPWGPQGWVGFQAMKPEMAQGTIQVTKPVMAQEVQAAVPDQMQPEMAQEVQAAVPDQAGVQADQGLLFVVGKGEARDGPEKASDGSKGPSPPLPKNPYRYLDRGWHSHQRRLERRKLARDGFDIPDELAPRRVEMSKTLKQHMFALQWAARRMADPSLDESELAAIEKQMQQSCEQTLDAPEPEMAEERMEVDEEEESFEVEEESCEVEVKTDSKKATARDGSKASGKQFFQMRSSKGTPSSGQERGSMGKPEMAPEVSKNKNVKEEKPEMAEKKRKKDKKSKSKSPDPPKGRDHDETGGPPGPPPPEPPTAEAVPAT